MGLVPSLVSSPHSMATKSPVRQRVQLTVDADLYDTYQEKGRANKRLPEEEMVARLNACKDHTSSTALYLDDSARHELEAIAGRQLKSAKDVVAWVRSIATFSVAGVNIPLSEQLMKRLDGRRFGKTLPEYVSRVTVELLEQSVGMR